MQIKLFMLIH